MRSNACVHRLDLGLYSHPKEFWGGGGEGGGRNGVRTYVNFKIKKTPTLYRKKLSPEEDRTQDAESSRTASPRHYQ